MAQFVILGQDTSGLHQVKLPQEFELHQKGGAEMNKSHESGAGLSLSFMACVPQQRLAVRIPEENGWDTEGEGKLASHTS